MNQLKDACVLMAGSSAWAFESLAEELSNLLQIEIAHGPGAGITFSRQMTSIP